MTQYLVIVQYDCRLGNRGKVISRHNSYDAARKAARKTEHDSFLRIEPREE